MRYAYYPGCSLTAGAVEYDASCREVMGRLDAELVEIPGWTCCGASAVEPVSRLLTLALPARNLALAERELPGLDVLVPCSACYLNHLRVARDCAADRRMPGAINEALSVENLHYAGSAKVRHLLDVLLNDFGPECIRDAVSHPLEGLVAAPYYGCQILRPYRVFDDPERPRAMVPLLEALGASALEWDKGGRCCGASLMATKREAALPLVADILEAARGADCIVTVCPMCQMNLEAYQSEAIAATGRGRPVSILYLPQLMGLAFGLSEDRVLLGKNLAVTNGFRAKLSAGETAAV